MVIVILAKMMVNVLVIYHVFNMVKRKTVALDWI